MKIMHVSDAHLKPFTWASWPIIEGDAYLALNEVAKVAQERGVDSVIISGDVTDGNRIYSKDFDALHQFCQGFKHVWHIKGTHDNMDPPVLLNMPNACYLPCNPQVIGDVCLIGIDYTKYRDDLLAQLQSAQEYSLSAEAAGCTKKYLVLHQAFQHLLGFDGTFQLTLDDIRAYCPGFNVLVGHVHVHDHTEIAGTRNYVHSTGVLFPQNWDQVNGYTGVDILDTDTGEIEAVPIHVREYVRLEASEDLFDKLKLLNQQHEGAVVKPAVRVDIPVGAKVAVDQSMFKNLHIKEYLVRRKQEVDMFGVPDMQDGTKALSKDEAIALELEGNQEDIHMMQHMMHDGVDPKTYLFGILKDANVEMKTV